MGKIFVLHENAPWVEPLWKAIDELGAPYEEWFLDEGVVHFDREPPEGVFYNRISASSHTRDHRYAPELTQLVLNWLELYDRRVVNGSRALYLEISKLSQYAALKRSGIDVPRTVAAVGAGQTLKAIEEFDVQPFVLKPNRGGKGLGVQVFFSVEEVAEYFRSPGYEEPIDGTWLIQEYIQSPGGSVIRCEFIGGQFLYAVQIDASQGFELCPADSCNIDTGDARGAESGTRFTITEDLERAGPIIPQYARFLRENGIDVAAIEFVADGDGKIYTYDVNTNTNYNNRAEAAANIPVTGMQMLACFLRDELEKITDV